MLQNAANWFNPGIDLNDERHGSQMEGLEKKSKKWNYGASMIISGGRSTYELRHMCT